MKHILLIFLIAIAFLSCRKENFSDDTADGLVFSTDTLTFDTVFTTIGTATRSFKVYNREGKDLKIKRIYLAGNNGFRLNINGHAANTLSDVVLAKDDSIFIFVEVKVNPLSGNSPIIVLDSVIFEMTSHQHKIYLMAIGQNVNKINGEIISGNVFWPDDKPYLIFNSMLVDTNSTLTIAAGARLHFHHQSRLYVAGTLICNGTREDPVTMQGDRLESWYSDVPGQWDGIYFLPGSVSNQLTHTIVKNAIIGIQSDTTGNSFSPTVSLMNVKLLNMNAVGIYGRGTSVHAVNTIVANCGQFAVLVVYGGSYEFYHCTIYNDWSYSNRTTPSVVLNNYYQDVSGIYQVRPLEKATFGNCIIHGSKETELLIDAYPGSPVFEYKFDHCIIKAGSDLNTSDANRYTEIFKNLAPKLKAPSAGNFEPDTLSNVINKGFFQYGNMFSTDFNGNSRTSDGQPDLGAYERVDLQ
jgi:hypothetical protein